VSAHTQVYLDHNATTALREAARVAMVEALGHCGNPSSVHAAGRAARHQVDQARSSIMRAIGLGPDGRLVFTSGGTEADHLALNGLAGYRRLIGATEHDAIRASAPESQIVPVDADGVTDLDALARLLDAARGQKILVSIMAANNETGVMQPVAEIARLVHAAQGLFHCDAVQAIGREHFDMAALGIDLATISAHKLGGPQGIGALAVAPGVDLAATLPGGGQERGLRGGTENVAGIVGFAAALDEAMGEADLWGGIADLRDATEARLLEIDRGARIFGRDVPRLANTLCIAMPGVEAQIQVMALDLAGIAVSAGSACSSGKVKPSHVLAAMGVAPDLARSAIRISFGRTSLPQDADRLVDAWTLLRRRTAPAAA
jgi:cysteine desulfurase